MKGKSLALPSLSVVVLKTGDFDRLKNWYTMALGCEPFFTRPRPKETSWTGAQQIAFFKLMGEYPYSQVLGIFEVDGTFELVVEDGLKLLIGTSTWPHAIQGVVEVS